MNSRASTSTISITQKQKPKPINTANHSGMVSSKAFTSSPTSFRSSPLNPSPPPSSPDKAAYLPRRSPTFPASRPLRPFPSISQSLASTKGAEMYVRNNEASLSSPNRDESNSVAVGKRSPKTIEISSKWKGGFFVVGMTQAEFSRRD